MRLSYRYSELLTGIDALAGVMGYLPGTAPEPVTDLIAVLSEELLATGEARAEYIIFDHVNLDPVSKTVEFEGVVFHVKPIIFSQIKNAEGVALFICTAGREVGELSRKSMKEGDLLRGYVYDVIGSEVAEGAADRMQEALKTAVALSGMGITNRFSPGYCGWDVAEQHKLFSFFTENYCGITLTDSALMNPVKSVSGMIGIGRKVKYAPYKCQLCDDKNCIYRGRKT
ncbi:MAG TPA: vitamin B12 dependent-methionine synthase activation domain-containing protein [Bacteroidales bacterium]|jgi:cobalamin-dependent methionine synthase I|nr:vitamin B12 dependent-methionine synthase activation domain-containing protein [Bacteroidales bacterium]HNX84624.1 vitamin B12 dependent-methionine synthase activation domain-containing protein [Bacteroidales bacterium]HPS96926.1 vitamin B12 dependent-methionine synthase activation domain-containing protein [Bacteroidales bacterium]